LTIKKGGKRRKKKEKERRRLFEDDNTAARWHDEPIISILRKKAATRLIQATRNNNDCMIGAGRGKRRDILYQLQEEGKTLFIGKTTTRLHVAPPGDDMQPTAYRATCLP
jgi:hypothetical protein